MLVFPTLAALRRRVARPILHRLRRPLLLSRMSRASEVRIMGRRFRTDPGVFHPSYFSSSRILAERLLEEPLSGLRVLDMGTGAGPVAVAAASAGARVTACDLNPRAVALSRENSTRNGLETEVLESDLFAALSGRQFDLIAFNLPFYARDPGNFFEAAYCSGKNLDTVLRFARGCPDHLAPGGRVIVVFSEDCDHDGIVHAFTDNGLCLTDEITCRDLFEDFHVAQFRRREGPARQETPDAQSA
jgi:release factor glutamine methyltransferase